MIVSIITAIVLYIISTIYLDQYYQLEPAAGIARYSLKRKRNQFFAVSYLGIGLAIGWLFPQYGYHWLATIKAMYLIAMILVIANIDQKEQIIPNKILLMLMWSALAFRVAEIVIAPDNWINIAGSAVIGGALGGGIFLVSHLIARAGIGAGDVKLFAVLGLYVGNYGVAGIMMISLLLTAVVEGIRVMRKKINIKEAVPFAPYVAVGVILSMLLGF